MATLKEAIKKVGVGGKVKSENGTVFTAIAIHTDYAWLESSNHGSMISLLLACSGWEPVLPKKRVVLQAWECGGGAIIWLREGADPKDYLCVPAVDIPDMIFEDGKQVFE